MAFRLVRNDITKMKTDIIVNTANTLPVVGPGCDRAIYEAAGYDALLEERKSIGEIGVGEVAITSAYNLDAKYIIHAVSPLFAGGDNGEEKLLRNCYKNSLNLAKEYGARSIAFPLISTGSFGYPREEGLRVALDEINAFLLDNEMEVYVVVFDEKATEIGSKVYPALETYIDRHYVEEKNREYADNYRVARRNVFMPGISASPGQTEPPVRPMASARPMTSARPMASFARPSMPQSIPMQGAADQKSKEKKERRGIFGSLIGNKEKKESNKAKFVDKSEICESVSAKDDMLEMREPASAMDNMQEMREPASPMAEMSEICDSAPLMAGEPKIIESQKPFFFDEEYERKLEDRMKHMSDSFSEYLIYLIESRGMKNSDVYKAGLVSKKTFSKIKNKPEYHPNKRTAMCLCVGAKLNLDETRDLLSRAGYALSPCDKSDIIFSFFIENEVYDIFEIDIQLEEHGLLPLVDEDFDD